MRTHVACGRRVVVVGTTGAGKSTLALRLARRLRCPHIELDALHWGPDWTPVARDCFRAHTRRAVAGDAWVADGNYRQVRDLVWGRADTIVWLDYPLRTVLPRLLRRTLRRCLSHEVLWHGNRERLRTQFLSRDSLFLWALQTHGPHRKEYRELFAGPACAHLTVVRLRSPRAAAAWLAGVHAGAEAPENAASAP